MTERLSSDEFTDRFLRSLKRAFDPVDLTTPRRLWSIRLFAFVGLIYLWISSDRKELSWPVIELFFFGCIVLLGLCSELKKLWDRVERLEAEVLRRDQAIQSPIEAVNRA
ncbi:MAG TPA: hypothetical protein VGP63_13480 [Planctomycetaceae bacterium]|jgi:hypothetical protein|nr:hypothetical protein [Planctomycetaceae bacterium]